MGDFGLMSVCSIAFSLIRLKKEWITIRVTIPFQDVFFGQNTPA